MLNPKPIRLALIVLLVGLIANSFHPGTKPIALVQVDKIVVYKSKRELLAYSNGELIKTYLIALGTAP